MGRTATASLLFCDLVASTELLSRLGDTRADEVRRSCLEGLGEAANGHRGRVVKNLGDGLMVAFTSAVDAVGTAVAMQRAIAKLARRSSLPLNLRVGLSAGEVSEEDGDYFGTPVVEAARLCAAAETGQILASDMVRALVGSRSPVPIALEGVRSLKGLSEPLTVVSVAWGDERGPVVSLPPLIVDRGAPFIGRLPELRELTGLLDGSDESCPRLVLVAGEPGVGKTTLVAEASRRLHADGTTVLWGRCDEEALSPYQPFIEAIEHLAATASPLVLDELPPDAVAEVARVVPGFTSRAGGLRALSRGEVDGDRFRLFEGVAAVLDGLAEVATLIVVIDDLHWADASTLALLRHLLRRPSSVSFVGTYREGELGRTHPLSAVLGDLRRETTVARVGLSGLAEDGVAALAAAATGLELDPDGRALARALHRATDGVPFFVQEVLRHLGEAGVLSGEAGWPPAAKLDSLGIPEGVREVIGRRLSHLSEEANQALALASVVGVEFVLDVVARIADTTESLLLDAFEEAHRAQLVGEVPGIVDHWRFAHPLVRETVYDELSASRRVRLHRRIAETVEELAGTDVEPWLSMLAYHFCAAGETVDPAKAADYARRAAEQALRALAYEEAARFADMGLESLTPPGTVDERERAGLLVIRGAAQVRTGDPTSAMTTFEQAAEAARSARAAELLARAAVGYDDAKFWDGRFQTDQSLGQRSADLLAEARAALGEQDSGVLVQVLSALAELAMTEDDAQVSFPLSAAAVVVAERLGDPWLQARALKARALAWLGPDAHPTDRVADSNRLIELAELTRDRELVYWGHQSRLIGLVEGGQLEAAEAAIEDLARVAAELHMEAVNADVELARGAFHLMRGNIAESERLAGEALAHWEGARYAGGQGLAGLQLLEACDAQGRLAEFEPWIDQMSDAYRHRAGEEMMLAGVQLRLGHLERARELYEPFPRRGFADIPRGFSWLWTMEAAVQVCAALDDRAGASTLLELLSPYPDRWIELGPMAVCDGSVTRLLGLLETVLCRYAEAERHFEQALSVHSRIDARLLVARTQLDYAQMLLARGEPADRVRADELLDSAAHTAAELGLKRIASEAENLRRDVR